MRLSRRAVILWSAVGLYYAALGLLILTPDAVYSGDIGVQYVQARALLDHRFRSLDITYPGEALDPDRKFFPIRPPFVFTAEGATQSIFPPASAVLHAIGVSALGLRGMILITVLAAWATVYYAARLSARRIDASVVVALGLASPLWFYAISGWHHAVGMALGTAAFVFALWPRKWMGALLAGIALGAGAALRDEVILLAPGLAAAIWFLPPSQPDSSSGVFRLQAEDLSSGHRAGSHRESYGGRASATFVMLGGAVLSLAVAAAVDVWWFDRPAAAHLRHAVHLLQKALHTTDAPNPDIPVLQPMNLRQRYETVIQYWLLGYGRDRIISLYAAGLVAALFVRARFHSSIGILVWLAGILGLAVQDFWELVTAPKWLAGLYRVAPYLVFAVLPSSAGVQNDPTGLAKQLPRIALIATGAYLALAFAGVDTTGGKGLGPRLLMPLLPLVAIAAVIRIDAYLGGRSRTDRWIGGAGLLLAFLTLIMHVYGTTAAYYARNREDADVLRSVAASSDRIVIADDVFTAQLLFPLYYRKIVFLADSQANVTALASRLTDARVPGALIVSRERAAKDLTGFRIQRNEQLGRMRIAHWVR